MTQAPTACAADSRGGVSAFAAIDRVRPPPSIAITSQPPAGIHAETRVISASATRSGSRLAFTARIMSASTSARESFRLSVA
jgi:hypothetical protein